MLVIKLKTFWSWPAQETPQSDGHREARWMAAFEVIEEELYYGSNVCNVKNITYLYVLFTITM